MNNLPLPKLPADAPLEKQAAQVSNFALIRRRIPTVASAGFGLLIVLGLAAVEIAGLSTKWAADVERSQWWSRFAILLFLGLGTASAIIVTRVVATLVRHGEEAAETLRASELRFTGAFEHAPIGVALVSPTGHWLKVNRALCELVGYSESELLTRSQLLKFTQPWPLTLPPEPRVAVENTAVPRIKILVAEDDPVSRELICARLEKWGYEVLVTQNGTEAMTELRKKDAPGLAILDWMMPGMDGLEVCRRVREADRVLYIILLTARGSKENLIEGLGAGADDYLIKPFDKGELHARILVGLRMNLQAALAERVKELEYAGVEIRNLRMQLPM